MSTLNSDPQKVVTFKSLTIELDNGLSMQVDKLEEIQASIDGVITKLQTQQPELTKQVINETLC